MGLYYGEKTRVRVDSELSDGFEVKMELHKRSVLTPPPLLAVVVDVPTQLERGVIRKLLYVGGLVLMSETIKGLGNKILKLE